MSGTRQNHNGDDSSQLELTQRIDMICDRFEAAWKAGRNPRIENYLGAVPESGRGELLLHLIELELPYRGNRGGQPSIDEYQARFPEYEDRVQAVFARIRPVLAPRAKAETPPEPKPAASRAHSDRNLLFGIVALQMDLITRDQLVAAMNCWVLDKHKSLGAILVAQGRSIPTTVPCWSQWSPGMSRSTVAIPKRASPRSGRSARCGTTFSASPTAISRLVCQSLARPEAMSQPMSTPRPLRLMRAIRPARRPLPHPPAACQRGPGADLRGAGQRAAPRGGVQGTAGDVCLRHHQPVPV